MTVVAPKEKALFCPACGGAAVARSPLGALVRCNVCEWTGAEHELAALYFEHPFGSDDKIARAFFVDIRVLLSVQVALGFGRLLFRWGFFMNEIEPRMLARYLTAISRALTRAILEERAQIEKELHGPIE